MKSQFKAYASFTRTERMGIIALLSLVIMLVIFKATMHLWVHPQYDKATEDRLIKSWETYKAHSTAKEYPQPAHPATSYHSKPDADHLTASKSTTAAINIQPKVKLFPFDPNTVDSPTLRKLGLREKTISIFLHWRAKGKKFYHKEEFKKVYTLTPEEYNQLEPYIIINSNH